MIGNKNWSWIALAAVLVAPLSANALGITIDSVQSTAPGALQEGDTITFNLRLSNEIGASINGLDIGVFGYDEDRIGAFDDDHLRLSGAQAKPHLAQFFRGEPQFDLPVRTCRKGLGDLRCHLRRQGDGCRWLGS